MKLHLKASLLSFLFISTHSWANLGEITGFGSKASGLAGAVVASGSDEYAAFHNPALLAVPSPNRLRLGIAFVYLNPDFKEINDVVVQNSFNSDQTGTNVKSGNVNVDPIATFQQTVGFGFHLFPEFYNLSLGAVISTPVLRSSYVNTLEGLAPEYGLYKDRTQRPTLHMAIAGEIFHGFQLGLGVSVGFETTTKVHAFLATDSNKTSSTDLNTEINTTATPLFGANYTFDALPLSLGLVTRLEARSTGKITNQSQGEIFSGQGSVGVNYDASVVHYYDPFTVSFGASWKTSPVFTTYLQADYERWSEFEPPILSIADSGGGIDIQDSKNPAYSFQDIVIPRVGEEFALSQSTTLRFGYAYKPSILKRDLAESGNFLDPPKHLFQAGVGFAIMQNWMLDFHLAYHKLVSQEVVKSPGGDSAQGSDNTKIGSPGYTAGGAIYGGGVSLGVSI